MNNFSKVAKMIYEDLSTNIIKRDNFKNINSVKYPHFDEKLLGGIYDGFHKSVLGEHYDTSFFMLNSLINYIKTHDNKYLELYYCSKKFVISNLNYFKYSEWATHRDFNNLTLSWCAILAKSETKLKHDQFPIMFIQRNNAGNWIFMKLLMAAISKKVLSPKIYYSILYLYFSKKAKRYINGDGSSYDIINDSAPIQYSAYITLMLYELYLYTDNKWYIEQFISGVNYLKDHMTFNGDFNYMGRGSRQIFGYACMYYVLNAAFHITGDKTYKQSLIQMHEFISKYLDYNGLIKLMMNSIDNKDYPGWYDYHKLNVYNSFFATIVTLSDYRFGSLDLTADHRNVLNATQKTVIKKYKTGFLIYNDYWKTHFTNPGSKYPCDSGFTPDLISSREFDILTSIYGPFGSLYGKKNANIKTKFNSFSPIFYDSEFPINSKINSRIIDNHIEFEHLENECSVIRKVYLEGKNLEFHDNVTTEISNKYRIFNLPLPTASYTIDRNKIIIGNLIIEVSINSFSSFLISNIGVFQSGLLDVIYIERNLSAKIKVTFSFL